MIDKLTTQIRQRIGVELTNQLNKGVFIMPRKKYTKETIMNCCQAYRAGESVANIAKKYNVSRSTLYSWIDRYRDIPDANDITVKKTLDNYKRKYEKEKQILEVLKRVECTRKAPLKIQRIRLIGANLLGYEDLLKIVADVGAI